MRRTWGPRSRLLAASLFLSAVAGTAPAGGAEYPQVLRDHPLLDRPAPAFALRSPAGKEVRLEDLRGRWVVLLFGATWCPYTNKKIQTLNGMWDEYRGRGVAFLTVSIEEEGAKVAKWAKRKAIRFPVLLDPEGRVAEQYAVPDAFPEMSRSEIAVSSDFLIDPEGRIVHFESCSPEGCAGELDRLRVRLDEVLAAK